MHLAEMRERELRRATQMVSQEKAELARRRASRSAVTSGMWNPAPHPQATAEGDTEQEVCLCGWGMRGDAEPQ